MDGAKPKAITGAKTEWVPPEPPEPDFLILPLNLRSQLARFGVGSDDLIVIDGMPEDAALTAGAKKPDGSWSLREIDLETCSFMPLYGNGETYTLRVCVLTPDPSDHGLAKTKGKAEIKVEVPLTPLPILEAFDDAAPPSPSPGPAPDTVIQLPADPKLKASAPIPAPAAAPAPATPAATPSAPAASSAAAQPAAAPAQPAALPKTEASRGSFDQQLAKLRAKWQAKVARQVAAAEERLKATHLAQLNRIQGASPQESGQRPAVSDSAARAELPAPPTAENEGRAPERAAGVDAQTIELRLAEARKQWQTEHEATLTQAHEAWRTEEAARLAAAEAAWRDEALQQRVALEARMEEGYKERLAAVEAALATKTSAPPPAAPDWSTKLENALADAQVGWEADEADRRAKLEAELTAAHERRAAELETQQAALYEMRLAAAEVTWQSAEAERLAAAEAAWAAGEAERLAAAEARWRAEHDQKLEAVLANFGTMVKGQLGAIGNASPLPAVEPAAAPFAPQAQPSETPHPEAADSDQNLGWRETAAA
jgi:hypothetical protein